MFSKVEYAHLSGRQADKIKEVGHMRIQSFKLVGLSLALAFLALAAVYSGLIGLAQASKTITVCASGCDFAKIQQAIDAATGGDTVQVQAGTYLENLTIRNKDGLTLKGAGADQVTLDGNGPQQEDITPGILILNSWNITVTGFKITNSRRGLEADDSTLLFIEANTFEKNLRQGIVLTRSEAQVKNNTIQGNQVDVDGTNGQGLFLWQGSQASITDNVIQENADCGLENRFQDSSQPVNQVTGSGNTITGNRGGDLCGNAPLALLAQPLPEGTLDQVSVPTDAPTLQEAVNKVKAGGTITIAAGTFQQPVEAGVVQIYKSVKILGAGSDQTVLQAPSPEWVVLSIATDGLDVTLQGLRVTGGRRGVDINTGPAGTASLSDVKVDGIGIGMTPSSDDAGIRILSQASVTIQKSTIADNASWGIGVFHNSRATLDGNTIARNVVQGIFVGQTARAQITNNQITGTKASSSCCGFGINVFGSSQATIQDNTISQNVREGIVLQGNAQATIQKNMITNNGDGGVVLFGSSNAKLETNTISGNVSTGVYLNGSSQLTSNGDRITNTKKDAQGNNGLGIGGEANSKLTIQNSTIQQNALFGVFLRDNTQATVQKSTITNNSSRGVDMIGNSKATLDGNTITGNVLQGIILFASAQATITNNQITDNKPNASGAAGQGVFVTGASRATITNNTIKNNNSHGIIIGTGDFQNETAQAEISNNTIQSNRGCGVFADSDSGIQITGRGNTISGNTQGQLCGTTSKFPAGFGGGK